MPGAATLPLGAASSPLGWTKGAADGVAAEGGELQGDLTSPHRFRTFVLSSPAAGY